MGSDASKPIPFNKMTSAELQKVRRRSLSDNNLTVPRPNPVSSKPKFRRTLSLKKSMKKRTKGTVTRQPVPVGVSVRDIRGTRAQGYLQKCQKGMDWESVWCMLSAGTLYVFASPLDEDAFDTIQLSQRMFRQYVEGYGGRHHVVEIRQEPYYPEFIAMETAEDMEVWLNHLKSDVFEASVENVTVIAKDDISEGNSFPETYTKMETSVLPSAEWDEIQNNNSQKVSYKRSQSDNCFLDNDSPNSPDSAQRELILMKKHKLLQEVLLQKQQLQVNKDAKDIDTTSRTDQPHSPTEMSPLTPSNPTGATSLPWQHSPEDEKHFKELILLKQRKMSTELKVETLQRMLHPSKTQKKSRIRLPNIRKTKSQENLCSPENFAQGHSSEELKHWAIQLTVLQDELGVLTGEIQEKEQRSTWYSGTVVTDDCSASQNEPRSVSLLSEKGLLSHYFRKPSSSSTKSDGCFDDDYRTQKIDSSKFQKGTQRSRLNAQNSNNSMGGGGEPKAKLQAKISNSSVGTTSSTVSFLTDTKSGSPNISSRPDRETLYTPNCKPTRTQKITSLGKKFPTFPSLRRGLMQKSHSQDDDDPSVPILLQERRSSFDICRPNPPEVDRPSLKRASVDDRLVSSNMRCSKIKPERLFINVNEKDEMMTPIVPPNSLRSSQENIAMSPEQNSNVSSPCTPGFSKSDSLFSSVMMAFDTISKTSSRPSVGSPDGLSRHSSRLSSRGDNSPSMQRPSETVNDTCSPCGTLKSNGAHGFVKFTTSLDSSGTDPELSSTPSNPDTTLHNSTTTENSPKLQISAQALENIAAFEELIHEKLGMWI